ncbi:MAG TPA: hypothetical protein VG714_01255 [Acidobacteriaceae bacterium]|nr:hypothetical protein [Acidobacteriaceae bacterium]
MPAARSQSGTETFPRGAVLPVAGGILLFLGLCVWLALGFGWLPGYPNPEEKSVPIYQPTAESAGLSLYLHPPLNSIQAAGESQLLAFQFVNHSGADLTLRSLDISPSECFRIAPHPEKSGGVSGVILKPGQSSLFWYRLSAHADRHSNCLAQFPLVFHYRWQTGPVASPQVEEESISTGPVEVTTRLRIIARRLVVLTSRIVPIILIPLLVAAGGWFFQEFQERRAAEQKKQEQKLQVWKTVLPGIIDAIRNHYIPMLSIISVMRAETSKKLPQCPTSMKSLPGPCCSATSSATWSGTAGASTFRTSAARSSAPSSSMP